jgi:hypothetical protein
MTALVTLQLTGKRKQALLESNLPGIPCSTGMVKESVGNTNLSFLWIIPRVGCLKKLKQKTAKVPLFYTFDWPNFRGSLHFKHRN